MKSLLLLSTILFLVSCQQTPTKIFETNTLNHQELYSSLKKPIQINDQVKVLDVRSALDYGLSHISGSQSIQWYTMSAPGSHPGHLDDPFKIILRLAAKGIEKSSPILIVGENNAWAAGRLAWSLLYLGFDDVQTSNIDSLKTNRNNLVAPVKKVSAWEPELRPKLLANKKQMVESIQAGKTDGVHIIDVRTEKEFFQKKRAYAGYALPEVPSINIDWLEFYDKSGRPNLTMIDKLNKIGIHRSDNIIVISNKGLRSAAATYALTMLGFANAANYAGGWAELAP